MLFLDTLRGKDATGIYIVNKYGNVEWCKGAVTGEQFINSDEGCNLLKEVAKTAIFAIGHNRSATIGKKVDENAHPFIENNTILVHNGTIRNQKELNSTVEVDSHAICHAIDEKGYKKALPLIDGAFALMGYNSQTKTLTIVRNKERPLFIGELENYWCLASEPWILYGTQYRQNGKFKEIKEVPIENLLEFKITEDHEIQYTITPISLEKPKQLPIIMATPFTKKVNNVKQLFKKNSNSYNKGDIINFQPQEVEMVENGRYRMIGLHDNDRVVCFTENTVTKKDIKKMMENELYSFVTSTYYNKHLVIYTEDPLISEPRISANGILLNEETTNKITICRECKKDIDLEDIENCYIKVRTTNTISCTCESCVKKHLNIDPKWGKILETQNSTIQQTQ